MKKLLDFGRKAVFYIRVLSGYEERQIRSCRLKVEQRLQLSQERKEAVKKIPEQLILSEVRRMVENMRSLNKRLEEMEVDINEYFKPIDKEVEAIISMQIEKEKAKTEMMGNMYKQAMLEKAAAEADSTNKPKMDMTAVMTLLEKAQAEASTTENKNPLNQT